MSLMPVDHMIKPVEDHDELVQFRQDFLLSSKAVDTPTVSEDENGDLIIEGYAAVFDGLDREGENFVPGAFQEGIKNFLDGQSALCYHHKHDHVLGRVLDLREEEGKGLWMRARVDKQEKSSPLHYIYNGIKKGSINGLSIGGFFRRAMVNGRRMIDAVDFSEVSTTAVPVHSGTSFSVVAGKALTAEPLTAAEVEPEVLPTPEPDVTVSEPELPVVVDEISEEDLAAVENVIDELSSFFEKIASRRQPKIESDDTSVTTTD